VVNHPNRSKKRKQEVQWKATDHGIGIMRDDGDGRYKVFAQKAGKVLGEFKTLKDAERNFDSLVLKF